MNDRLTPRPERSPETREAVEAHTRQLLEQVLDRLTYHRVETVAECREQLSDLLCVDGTEIVGMSLDEQLDLVEEHAADLDLRLASVDIESLRAQVETLAAHTVHALGEEQAAELLLDLEDFMTRHGLEVTDMISGNHLGHLPHRSERDEADGCVVYEYRNVDGLDVDVYEVRFGGSWGVSRYRRETDRPEDDVDEVQPVASWTVLFQKVVARP
jgi:hypothetical protein